MWTERYATQPEILRYLNHVADRFDLRRDIAFHTQIAEAVYDDDANTWTLVTDAGERVTARYCISGVGNLSSIKRPDFAGLDDFAGACFHTAEWPHEGVDFAGKRVAFVGTGSTGIQAIPQIARQAERLHVFQRTANYSMPAVNRPLDPAEVRAVAATYPERRRAAEQSDPGVPHTPPQIGAFDVPGDERRRIYEAGWAEGGIGSLSGQFNDVFTSADANFTAQEFAREKIREIVHDPAVAELLCPSHYIGMRRTCVDIDYFETYNRDNVELIDVRRSPITRILPHGIATAGRGVRRRRDRVRDRLRRDDRRAARHRRPRRAAAARCARSGRTARAPTSAWPWRASRTCSRSPGRAARACCRTWRCRSSSTWTGSPTASSTSAPHGLGRIEATPEAEDAWVQHVNELADETLYTISNSWYIGSNIEGKPRVFMPYVGGCGRYRGDCDAVAAAGYEGFTLAAVPVGAG